jgi:hypothetical protein
MSACVQVVCPATSAWVPTTTWEAPTHWVTWQQAWSGPQTSSRHHLRSWQPARPSDSRHCHSARHAQQQQQQRGWRRLVTRGAVGRVDGWGGLGALGCGTWAGEGLSRWESYPYTSTYGTLYRVGVCCWALVLDRLYRMVAQGTCREGSFLVLASRTITERRSVWFHAVCAAGPAVGAVTYLAPQ